MLYAPITRLYTETYAEPADTSKTLPYYRNNIKKPRGMSECLGYLKLWKEHWKGDCFCYEYHFMDFQYYDISNLFMSKIVYDDIVALKTQGLNGIIEDGSQRSYFPTGFQFYVYGETLFDRNVSFDALKEDYFSHAFGENWRQALSYLESLRDDHRARHKPICAENNHAQTDYKIDIFHKKYSFVFTFFALANIFAKIQK